MRRPLDPKYEIVQRVLARQAEEAKDKKQQNASSCVSVPTSLSCAPTKSKPEPSEGNPVECMDYSEDNYQSKEFYGAGNATIFNLWKCQFCAFTDTTYSNFALVAKKKGQPQAVDFILDLSKGRSHDFGMAVGMTYKEAGGNNGAAATSGDSSSPVVHGGTGMACIGCCSEAVFGAGNRMGWHTPTGVPNNKWHRAEKNSKWFPNEKKRSKAVRSWAMNTYLTIHPALCFCAKKAVSDHKRG